MTIPSSGNVDKSNLFSQPHANIYNLMNDRSNVPDPNDSTGNRKFIHVREPRNLGRGFKGYPFIVVPNNEFEQGKGTVSATKSFTTFDVIVRVVTADKSSDSDGNSSGAQTMNTICNKVVKTLNANRTTLRNYGMKKLKIKSEFDPVIDNGLPIFFHEFTLTFVQLGLIA